ncbi:peptide chain release factor N(5)-glutamine methyltransferase [Ahrensia marina]|uniref:peptide chain release factor N(5)-glutamine methyltransferase n=1 Tax=Ahrensia marina TaxID=1514904 RepID=UPI0035CEE9C9
MSPTFNALVRDLATRIDARPDANGLREARLLVEHVTGHSTAAQIVVGDHTVPQSDHEVLMGLLARRETGEPLARLLGHAAFWDFEVGLNDATLVPRDDTGTLVEAALALLPADSAANVVDVGTGSGIVLLALARERPHITGTGIDVASDAVTQAQANAIGLGLDDRLTFFQSNWLDAVDGPLDMVVSNPPYIRSGDMASLSMEVREHDPALALVAGEDGLDAYRALLPQIATKLKSGGHALLEIGHNQAEDVSGLGEAAGLSHLSTAQDLSGRDRVVAFQR